MDKTCLFFKIFDGAQLRYVGKRFGGSQHTLRTILRDYDLNYHALFEEVHSRRLGISFSPPLLPSFLPHLTLPILHPQEGFAHRQLPPVSLSLPLLPCYGLSFIPFLSSLLVLTPL